MNQVCFLYNNKRYPFNFESFRECSGYISRTYGENFENNENYIDLLSEFDYCKELSDDSIKTFICFCQNQTFNLTNTNVIDVKFLSIKYDVPSLTNKTNKYIKKHYTKIVNQLLSTNIDKKECDPIFHIYETIISDNILFYLSDHRLLSLSINKLYRILFEYSKQEITDQKLKENIDCQLVEFLIKYVKIHGNDASFLFSIIKIGYKGSMLLNDKLSQCNDFIDFKHVEWTIFQNINYMNIKQKKKAKKERQKIRSNLINSINELFQMEQLNQDHNDEENNKSIAFMKYGFLYSIGSIYDDDDKKEKDIKKLSRFDLLNFLLKENLFSTNSSILIENRKYIDIISIISKLTVDKQKESIIKLFKLIDKDNNAIDFVDKAFPYYFFKNLESLKLLLTWIPCIRILLHSKIQFSVEIEKNKFEFNSSSNELKIKVNLKFNKTKDLSLSQESEILYNENKKTFNLTNINEIVIYYLIEELATKKMKTEEKMKDKEILYVYYLNAIEKYSTFGDQILHSNHILSVKDLFSIEKNYPIICLMWNLIFSLTETEILDISKIINPIESKILISIQAMFNNVNFDNAQEILNWNKWAYNFDSFMPTIAICLMKNIDRANDFSSTEIDSLLNIKNAIDYLKKTICIFWKSKDLINICQKEYDQLNALKIQRNKLNIKFDTMIQNIANTEVNQEYAEMKNTILKLINKNQIRLSDDNYCWIKKILNLFIVEATSKNENKIDSNIIEWPPIATCIIKNETKNIRILKSLIWYSEIKRLLIEIKENKKIFYNLLQLKNCPSLYGSWEYLLKIIIFQLNESEYSNLFNNLNAHLIIELFNIDHKLITHPNYLCNIINDYSKREPCQQTEIQWIYKMIVKFSSDFLITIPQLNPNSIISLIINKTDDVKFQYGPLISSIDNLDLQILEDQIPLISKQFGSFIHAAKSVTQIIYNSVFDKNKISPQNIDSLKKFFEFNSNDMTNYKSHISVRMKTLFLIAESLDKWTKPKLIFDDFIYTSAQIHFAKYPSLLKYLIVMVKFYR